MLGTKDLGIQVNWRFRFLGHGSQAQPSIGSLYVDLGGILVPGVIDHHFSDSNYESTTSSLARNPHLALEHLLGLLNRAYYQGLNIPRKKMTFEFVTHNYPDWDGMNCFYLTDYLVQNGRLPDPPVTAALCEAADEVDQGRARIRKDVARPFLIYLMMMNNGTTWEDCLLRGARLLEHIIKQSASKISRESFLSPFAPPEEFANELRQLKEDYSLFEKDLANAEFFEMVLPTKDSVGVSTKALAFKTQPQCSLHKYWAREESDAGILFVPFLNQEGKMVRVIISVDPYSDFVLPCLGLELEKAETGKRKGLGKSRTGKPRFEMEYCDNDDPWYDGRGHGFTIVDSPRAGTVLEYAEILDIAKNLFRYQPEQQEKGADFDAFLSYRRAGGSDTAWALKTQLEMKGKKVFLDVDSLRSGPFDTQLIEYIARSRNFISLLTSRALDRCKNQDDWVRKEILEAINRKKNVIPVITQGSDFPSPDEVPAELQELLGYNAVTLNHEYFYACVEKILRFMV